jgi:hypothetical protein
MCVYIRYIYFTYPVYMHKEWIKDDRMDACMYTYVRNAISRSLSIRSSKAASVCEQNRKYQSPPLRAQCLCCHHGMADGRWLRMHWISSRGQPIRGVYPTWWMVAVVPVTFTVKCMIEIYTKLSQLNVFFSGLCSKNPSTCSVVPARFLAHANRMIEL